jgi:uncharacterized protein YhaN
MKLISYHIENYGKIHGQDGAFGAGMTELCENNGYGKSTLASFICAMFYGLPTYTARTKTFDDRQHFYPFDGGKFGGNLTFEMQGKTYKIERVFDKKSAKDDEVKVYCDGVLYDGFGEDIGKAVFGLDEESFKKTVFITADEIEVASTASINEKLNRDLDGGEDVDFEGVLATLEKAKKELKAGRGNNDLISKKKAEMLELNDFIKNLKDMSDGLAEEYIERERLTKEIAVMKQELDRASGRGLVVQKWKTFDSLASQAEEKQAQVKRYEAQYPSGVPNADEIETMRACVQEETRLTGSLQGVSFGEDKEKLLADLTAKFQNGAPRDEIIAQKQQSLTRLATLKADCDKLQNTVHTAREKELENRFSGKIPTEEKLLQVEQAVEEYKTKDARLKELNSSLIHCAPAQSKQSKKGIKPIYWIFAALFGVIGIVLLILKYFIPAMVFGISGPMIFLIGGYAYSLKESMVTTAQPSEVTVQMATLQGDIKILEESIRAFTVPYGYYGNAGVLYDFASLKEDLRAYKVQVASEQEDAVKAQALSGEIERITSDVQAFLQGYGESGADLQNGLNRLLAMTEKYTSLKADKAAASGQTETLRARILQCKNTLAGIVQKYSLNENVATMYGLNNLEMDGKGWKKTEEELAVLVKKLETYKTENSLTERPTDEGINVDELRDKQDDLIKQLASLDKRIAETERAVEKLPDAENELERADETLKLYKEKYELLSDTMDALKEAEKALKDKYIAPIKGKFSFYAEALERVLDEKVEMDSDCRITFERGGQVRSDKHLSAGERSLCALCFRLALLDNMYETEQPFIVMDDPFVHLDKTHIERTAALMQELAKERQIIYFCCHESRSMTHKM